MGVNIFILDRRPVRLSVAGTVQSIGSLRRFFKITELNDTRAGELHTLEATASLIPSPKAAMIADIEELPLGSESGALARAHLVIGWDDGRTSVTDLNWDYLPRLGYAVREPNTGVFILYAERDGVLHTLDHERAVEGGLVDPSGELTRHGQPTISECPVVRPFISGYGEANCTFDDGRRERLLFHVTDDALPQPSWFIGKTPAQVQQYKRTQDGPSTGT